MTLHCRLAPLQQTAQLEQPLLLGSWLDLLAYLNNSMSFWRLLCCENQAPEPARRSQKVFVAYKEGGKYEGEQSNQKRNGYGVFTYPNQDQYDGEWLNDKRHGRGKMLFSNGDFYMGEWVNDRKEGRGLHVSHQMWKYQGEWKSGEIDGLGKLVQVDGSFYQGQFKAGKRDGKGLFYNSQNKKKYINVYKGGELQKCELLLSAEKQNSPGGHSQRDLASGIAMERTKVTQQDIKLYEACNPELKEVNFDQLMSYIEISKVREMHFIKIHPSQWKADHINSWLKVIDLADYQETFAKSKVSGSVMLQLSEDQLKQDLKMKLGDRKKFMKAVNTLKNLHQPKKQKRVLKHLKPFKKAITMNQGHPVSSSTRKAPNSNRFANIKTDAIVQQIGENQDHDDSPGNDMQHSHRRKQSHTRRVEKDEQVQQNRDYHTYVWRTYNTLGAVNRGEHLYDSLNIQERDLDSHADLKSHEFEQKIEEQLQEESVKTKQNEAIETLALVPLMMTKKQTSKRVQKKKEQDQTFEPHIKKEQSKKTKDERQKQDDTDGKEDMKRVEQEDTETSSEDSQTEEKVPNKRKRSRDERSMQMRQLYEFLKQHHISMNFLIPQNQLTHMQEIGEGGYGKVYKAKYMSDRVAVKTYVKSGRIHRKSLNDFLKQVQILNDLRHPNVVLYMGMCVQISRYSLVTEYLEQGSLFDQLHKKHTKLSTQKIYEIVEDIVLGMVYLHAKGILHRDLKSSNVLIADDWKVKLCDFGLSVIHNNKKKKKVNSQRIGTYQWMAPEVLRREQIGFPADVYSFGMILWQLLAHQIPFKDYTVAQIEGLVAYDQTFNMEAPPHSDPLLARIMKKCLQKEPHKRPTFLNILDMLKQGTSMSDIL